jgi:dihydroorotate dehydrogenase electron transfer subunit
LSRDHTFRRRGSILLRDARVLANTPYAGNQYVLRLEVEGVAERALPGSFVHLQCDADLPMRRPMSIMRASPPEAWIEILYKAHGQGTSRLARRRPGETLSVLGPIGKPFRADAYRPMPLLMGGGVGIPPMLFLAEHMRGLGNSIRPLVLMGSEVPFPFRPRPSKILVEGMPEGVIAAMPLLEDWGVASRLASRQGFAGCFEGLITDLARAWLNRLDAAAYAGIEIFACGPTQMLRAVQTLAAEYQLPCELSVEEFMACGVGGCAGCAVLVRTAQGTAMKRVCVDGPVFDASEVVFAPP